jgi:hypothetical protein
MGMVTQNVEFQISSFWRYRKVAEIAKQPIRVVGLPFKPPIKKTREVVCHIPNQTHSRNKGTELPYSWMKSIKIPCCMHATKARTQSHWPI